ncbi:aldo-keto reductase 1B-like [Clavelina lepadiformis]|uniref:aldo-keto reductase 1B-like n=1 Tax=Clavelina lepadiformis TaxID=159417 RepID=UPI0040415FBA
MENVPTVRLQTGYAMPLVGLGTWQSLKEEGQTAVECAIACGYRHIDCAWMYQNENEMGKAITKVIKENKVQREELFITSKLWSIFHKPELVRTGFMKSLNKLNLKYLDLYLIHSPCGNKYVDDETIIPKGSDGKTLFDDTDYVKIWKVLEDLQKEGLIRSIGVSNFNKHQINRILKECSVPPAVNQIEINPYLVQKDLVDFCNNKGIVVTAFSPLGSPTRPWVSPEEPALLKDPSLEEIAKRLEKSVAQVTLFKGKL